MTDIDTEELRRLTREATPGHWFWTGADILRAETDHGIVGEPMVGGFGEPEWDISDADAALIVAARNAIPDLLAALDAKDAEIGRLRSDLALAAEVIRAESDYRRAKNAGRSRTGKRPVGMQDASFRRAHARQRWAERGYALSGEADPALNPEEPTDAR